MIYLTTEKTKGGYEIAVCNTDAEMPCLVLTYNKVIHIDDAQGNATADGLAILNAYYALTRQDYDGMTADLGGIKGLTNLLIH